MELLLRLQVPDGRRPRLFDIAVDVDPRETIARLTDSLTRFVADEEGMDWAVPTALSDTAGRPFDPDDGVLQAGLHSGQTVVLAPASRAIDPPRRVEGLSLEISAGPAGGRFVALAPGRYTVGRDGDCDVVIDDPTLSRVHLTLDCAHRRA